MDTVDHALTWIFAISLVLVLIAYYAGTQAVLGSLGSNFDNLLLVLTGRNTQTGAFAGYPH